MLEAPRIKCQMHPNNFETKSGGRYIDIYIYIDNIDIDIAHSFVYCMRDSWLLAVSLESNSWLGCNNRWLFSVAQLHR